MLLICSRTFCCSGVNLEDILLSILATFTNCTSFIPSSPLYSMTERANTSKITLTMCGKLQLSAPKIRG